MNLNAMNYVNYNSLFVSTYVSRVIAPRDNVTNYLPIRYQELNASIIAKYICLILPF